MKTPALYTERQWWQIMQSTKMRVLCPDQDGADCLCEAGDCDDDWKISADKYPDGYHPMDLAEIYIDHVIPDVYRYAVAMKHEDPFHTIGRAISGIFDKSWNDLSVAPQQAGLAA